MHLKRHIICLPKRVSGPSTNTTPFKQPSSVATTVPVPFELVNALVFGCLDETKLLLSPNNALADPDFLPSELFCNNEPVLEPGVFGCRIAVLKLVGLEYT